MQALAVMRAVVRAVLPVNARCSVLGGITSEKMAGYLNVGTNGFELRSALLKLDYSLDELRKYADEFIGEIGR